MTADHTGTRVLQVVLSLNPGGTERLVVQLATRLHADMPTAVCCLDAAGAWAAELESAGIAVTALGRRPGFHPSLGRQVARVARAHGATVMHAHHYSPFVYAAMSRLAGAGAGLVFTEHGRLSDAGPSARRRLANAVLGRAPDRVFTVSGDLKQHLVEEGFRADAVGVIYNGVDLGPLPASTERLAARERLSVSRDTFIVGTIARLDPVKDLGTLLRAVAALPSTPPVLVVVVGDGPERASLEALAGDLGVAGRVRFLGHRQDARAWLAGFDTFVNCSISEGISLTILEAMAAGVPVVATRVGGTPEVVDRSSGRLVAARDATALAGVLGELGRDADSRNALGAAARARAEARFTLDRMIGEYREVYRSVSAARAARRS